jgi:hypothetical protein
MITVLGTLFCFIASVQGFYQMNLGVSCCYAIAAFVFPLIGVVFVNDKESIAKAGLHIFGLAGLVIIFLNYVEGPLMCGTRGVGLAIVGSYLVGL